MKGRARALLDEFATRHQGLNGRFVFARLILITKVVPENITRETDDPELEKRIERAIDELEQSLPSSRPPRG